MKYCDKHWEKTRDAIKERGLWHLVGRSGEEAVDRLIAEAQGTATDATFDPLLAVCNMVYGKAVELGGLWMLTGEDKCPVCTAMLPQCRAENTPEEMERFWIDGPCDSILTYCTEKGLVPTP